MNDADSETESCCDLPDLFGLVRSRLGLIVGMAMGFLVLAVIGAAVKAPVFEATAFLEVEVPAEIATIEAKLKFPSLYRKVAGNDDAARDLAERTRVKNPRGSRILAVTVRHSEPESAAKQANAVAEAFVAGPDNNAAADGEEADSLKNLAASWGSVSAEFEKLSKRYADEANHPAVIGAKERRDAVAARIRERLGIADGKADLNGELESLLNAENRMTLEASETDAHLVEAASVPQVRAGPNRLIVLFGAAMLGAGLGAVLGLCGCCQSRKA